MEGQVSEKWWYKLITFSAIRDCINNTIGFFKQLTDKTDPHSSHRAINLTWGIGSFVCYWADHFIFNRGKFTKEDFIFITVMAGVTTLAAAMAKFGDKPIPTDTPQEVKDGDDNTTQQS